MRISIDKTELERLTTDSGRLAAADRMIKGLKQDLELLATAINHNVPAFKVWLLEQDLSSTMSNHRSAASRERRIDVEKSDDTVLALAWANSREIPF